MPASGGRLSSVDRTLIALSMTVWYLAFGVVGWVLIVLQGLGGVDLQKYRVMALATYWSSPLVGALITRWLVGKKRPFSVLCVATLAVAFLAGAELARPSKFPSRGPKKIQKRNEYYAITWGLRLGAVVTGSILGTLAGERISRGRKREEPAHSSIAQSEADEGGPPSDTD